MPRASRRRTRRAVVAALFGVAAAAGMLVAVVLFASDNPEEVRLGDDTFSVSTDVADSTPFLLSDVSGRQARPVYLQHLGPEEDEGWSAFLAVPDGSGVECAVRWDGREFVDPCTGDRYPADGEGLQQIPVAVDGNRVEIDLRRTSSPSMIRRLGLRPTGEAGSTSAEPLRRR